MAIEYNRKNGVKIRLKDYVNHPAFVWKDTLLNYDISFNDASELRESGVSIDRKSVPFQLSGIETDGRVKATLSLITDLKPGEDKEIEIGRGIDKTDFNGIERVSVHGGIALSNGSITVYIPKSGIYKAPVPAPITGMKRDKYEYSGNIIENADGAEIETRELDFGALFCRYEVKYRFAGGGSYTVIIRLIHGYDFVELYESAEGMDGKNIAVKYCFDGFNPDRWHMTTWPDAHWDAERYGEYSWRCCGENRAVCYCGEDPPFQGDGSAGGIEKICQIKLGPYAPFFAYTVRPCGAMWNEKTGESIGYFVNGNDNWNDNEYPIWSSGKKLLGEYRYIGGRTYTYTPVGDGKRSVAVACYDRQRDIEHFKWLENLKSDMTAMGVSEDKAEGLTKFPTTYTAFLHNRYVTLNLDKVKDWVLHYEGRVRELELSHISAKSGAELERLILESGRCAIATKGVEEFHQRPLTFEAVEMRMMYDIVADSYIRLHKQLDRESLERVTALILITVYVCAGEEGIPMLNMLGGHPNFLADMKSVIGLGAFLFPEHPHSRYFASLFERYIDLNTRYHTRAAKPETDAEGGRWTEAIGIYTWAFLTPTALVNSLLKKYYDGADRLANEKTEALLKWILNITTAPVIIDGQEIRALPPQGAHSALRSVPRLAELAAQSMECFNPVLADNLYYITRDSLDLLPENNGKHLKWEMLYKRPCAPYARPELKSRKYAGYGVVLRYGVYTENEMSVHLQQINRGNNYRWGMANEGGCGNIYYCADKTAYSCNGKEDAGDRRCEDAMLSSNFGVWKNNTFRSIGMNDMEYPMLGFRNIQYYRINSRRIDPYSYPEYRYRSVMTLGGDYLVVYDCVDNPSVDTRFSWFVEKGKKLPFIHFVKGPSFKRYAVDGYGISEHITAQTYGKWYEGQGDSMAVISYRDDINVKNRKWGCIISSGSESDFIFQAPSGCEINESGIHFSGRTGAVRCGGAEEWYGIIDGSALEYNDFGISVSDGISCEAVRRGGGFYITVYCRRDGIICINSPSRNGFKLYMDRSLSDEWEIAVTKGRHTLEYTGCEPVPEAPRIKGISGGRVILENRDDSCSYAVEYSLDGKSFEKCADKLPRLEQKAVIRVKAVDGASESEYSAEYPYFPNISVPSAPEGLKICGRRISWGKVYSAEEYVLYRNGIEIYRGTGCEYYDDESSGIYCVCAVNGCGSGAMSRSRDREDWLSTHYPDGYDDGTDKPSVYIK